MACGAGKLGDWLIPDSMLGVELERTCQLHDALYVAPGGRTRADCDAVWLLAMLQTAQRYGRGRRAWGWRMVLVYYVAVRLFGWWPWVLCRWRSRGWDGADAMLRELRAIDEMQHFGLLEWGQTYTISERRFVPEWASAVTSAAICAIVVLLWVAAMLGFAEVWAGVRWFAASLFGAGGLFWIVSAAFMRWLRRGRLL
jgi:hypothetical protein